MKILFVCLGNICRSPAAEGVAREHLARAGLAESVEVQSRGTAGWHEGKLPDQRMRAAAAKRGVALESRARQLTVNDLREFDHIYCMDRSNLENARQLTRDPELLGKLRLFTEDLVPRPLASPEVPDPYYDGPEAFEHVLDLLEEGCAVLATRIRDGKK